MNTASKLLLVASLGLGGCATVVKGTKQDVAISTDPPGASCMVSRNGAEVAMIAQTPGIVQVSRDRAALVVSCTKAPEFAAPATQTVDSKFNGATLGNILLGGVVGVVVDASTGANYSYPEQVAVSLGAGTSAPLAQTAPLTPAPVASAPGTDTAGPRPGTIKTETGTITMKPVND
ncbi:MAG: hypothetical protein HOP13_20920 [Alphaproteobacteria bacterium]|nr:hypothetical protein [Alphaproteobacteria bacterium]